MTIRTKIRDGQFNLKVAHRYLYFRVIGFKFGLSSRIIKCVIKSVLFIQSLKTLDTYVNFGVSSGILEIQFIYSS